MPFGFKCALKTFQREMDDLFTNVKWQIALVHLDDLEMLSETLDENIDNVDYF